MSNIQNVPRNVISDELYKVIHHYIALDREIKKFEGKPIKEGSTLYEIYQTREKLKVKLDEEGVQILFEIVDNYQMYQVLYKNVRYKIDEEFAFNAQRILTKLVHEYSK
ncbi:hypothetical protein ACFGYI_04175 [Pasteurella multocida]|nr:hypothetical protein [Pasteurella multocida]